MRRVWEHILLIVVVTATPLGRQLAAQQDAERRSRRTSTFPPVYLGRVEKSDGKSEFPGE